MTLNNETPPISSKYYSSKYYSFYADTDTANAPLELPWLRLSFPDAVPTVSAYDVRTDKVQRVISWRGGVTARAWRDDLRQGWHIVPCHVRYVVVKGAPVGQAFAALTFAEGARDVFRTLTPSLKWYADAWRENWGIIDLHRLGLVTEDSYAAIDDLHRREDSYAAIILPKLTGPTPEAIVEAYAMAQRADKRTGVWTFDGSGELVLLVEGIEVPMTRVQALWAEALAAKRSAAAKQERNQIVCEGDLPCQLLGQDTDDILK